MIVILELVYLCSLFVGTFTFAHLIAKYGVFDFALAKPKTTFFCFLITVLTLFFGRNVNWYMREFEARTAYLPTIFVVVLPLLWIFFFRYIIMSKGQFDYNRAKARLHYWTNEHFSWGTVLKNKGEKLKKFSPALTTIRLFQRSIEKQIQGVPIRTFKYEAKLDVNRRSFEYEYLFNCPVCTAQQTFPDCDEVDMSFNCSFCGSIINGRKKGGILYLNIRSTIKMRKVTDENRRNIAVALCELGLQFRIMNLFEEAIHSLMNCIYLIDDLLAKAPDNYDYLATKRLAKLHLAEIYHATGQTKKARFLYEESLQLNEKLGDEIGIREVRGLLNMDQVIYAKEITASIH